MFFTTGDHHLLFMRLPEGMTQDEMRAVFEKNEDRPEGAVFLGGNGFIDAGDEVRFSLDLEPGLHAITYYTEDGDPLALAFFTVAGPANDSQAPKTTGKIELGPGYSITLPSKFDAEGTYEIVNRDGEIHEGSYIRLEDGTTVDDIMEWGQNGFEGPPPAFSSAGGFGALDGGRRAWITNDLKPGKYAIICWLPNAEGEFHFASGMITPFTIE